MSDSHLHLTLEPLASTIENHLKLFKQSGGKHLLNVAFTPESITESLELHIKYAKIYPGIIKTSIGIHPEYFSELSSDILKLYKEQKRLTEELLTTINKHKDLISAIGETGLDYHHLENIKELSNEKKNELIEVQKASFKNHIQIAKIQNLPMTIHSRDVQGETRCIEDVLEIVTEVGKGEIKGCFHSFTGEKKYVKDILSLGFCVGFNGIITYPNAENVRDILRITPKNRVLLETDSPLLPPQGIRSNRKAQIKYGTPSDIAEIAKYASEILGITEVEMLEINNRNFELLFL